MKLSHIQTTFGTSTIKFFLISIFFIFGIAIQSNFLVNAQLEPTSLINNTLFVTGSATTNIKTDKATISLGVETTNKTAEKALVSNSNLMNKIINALKGSGIQANETRTSSFTINPNYNYSEYGSKGDLIGFTVSNSIYITSSNIDLISLWIDTAVKTGANAINEVYFTVSPDRLDKIKNDLLKDAVANAKSKADIVAEAAGLNIVEIKSITIGELGAPPIPGPVPVYSKSVAFDETSSTPILSGEQEITATVSIVYSLGQ